MSASANASHGGALKGVYAHLDCLVDAIDALKRAGHRDFAVTAPLPRHEIEHLIYEGRPSPVRWFTMTGALFGGISGFALCSLTHLNWPMIIPAGKPLVSIAPFIVITFEMTVLWGCLFTLVGLLWTCGLPARKLPRELEDSRLSDDLFGLVVNGLSAAERDDVREILNRTGAIEIDGMEVAHASAS